MDLYLLIERTTNNEDAWHLMGIFDTEEKALEKGEEYKIKVVRNHLICDGYYMEIRKIKGNEIDDIFYGYDGFFEECSPKVREIHYQEDRMKSIMIQVYYRNGFRKNIHCLTEEEYVYHMKMYGFDPEKDGCKVIKEDGKEIEYFFPKTRIIDDKIYRVREIIVDKNRIW